MAKKYYWLKLKEDFFRNKKIKKLRSIAGGDTYTIIYLKMQLLSLKNDGWLLFDEVEEDFASEIALEIDEDVDNVKITISYLIKNNLIEMVENDKCILHETIECIGSESQSAARVRKYRALKGNSEQKVLQCNTNVTKCNTEIEKEKEKEKDIEKEIDIELEKKIKKTTKHKHGTYQRILLTDAEYEKLCNEFGKTFIDNQILLLDEYVESNNNKNGYKNFNLVIRKSIRENWFKQTQRNANAQPTRVTFADINLDEEITDTINVQYEIIN